MTLELFRILIDFGLVILIWIVQLVIYPGFKYYAKDDLVKWHNIYTRRITLVVFPLMFGQLIVGSIQIWQQASVYTVISFLIILSLWGMTMWLFVPLHNKITNSDFDEIILSDLVNKNWIRTFLWTLLFFMSIWQILVALEVIS